MVEVLVEQVEIDLLEDSRLQTSTSKGHSTLNLRLDVDFDLLITATLVANDVFELEGFMPFQQNASASRIHFLSGTSGGIC